MGVILNVKESIQAYEIKLEREADCDEAVWCKIVSGNSTLTIELVYRGPNIKNEEDNTKIKNAVKEVSKGHRVTSLNKSDKPVHCSEAGVD